MLLKFIIIFLILLSNIYAQNSWNLKAGINASKFRDNDSELLINYSLGLSRQLHITENYYIIPEIFITKQGSLIKEKPVKTDDWEWYLYSYDIHAELVYFEFPILISYGTSLKKNNIYFYLGPSFRFAFGSMDRTKLSNEKIIYDDDQPDRREEFENYNFEFVQGDYEGSIIKSPAWSVNLGFAVDLNILDLELRYTYTFNEIGQIGQLDPIKRYLHSLHLLLGIHL